MYRMLDDGLITIVFGADHKNTIKQGDQRNLVTAQQVFLEIRLELEEKHKQGSLTQPKP